MASPAMRKVVGYYRFIGADGSMGFAHGATYRLSVRGYGKPTVILPEIQIPYGSWEAFYRNWQDVPAPTVMESGDMAFGRSDKTNYESDVKLGEQYEDIQTGIEGRATAIYFFEFACERVTLERLVEGKILADTFDAPRLKHVATQQVAKVKRPGGPGDGRDPRAPIPSR